MVEVTARTPDGKTLATWQRDDDGNLIGPLTFADLAIVNIERCRRWHDPESWSPQMWGLAAAGEMGECCNALKKLWRHDNNIQQNAVRTPSARTAMVLLRRSQWRFDTK